MKSNLFDLKLPNKPTIAQGRPDYVALEELADGVLRKENEVVIYAKLTDPSYLETLPKEEQEQYSYSFNTQNDNGILNVKSRVRKTTKDGNEEYVRTTKVFSEPDSPNQIADELSVPTNKAEFDLFKTFTENGMIKTRFFLPLKVEGSDKEFTVEIDAFPKEGGGFNEWVKIDIEISPEDNDLAKWEDLLPDVFTDKIRRSANNTEEEKATISKLYEEVFLTHN